MSQQVMTHSSSLACTRFGLLALRVHQHSTSHH